MNQFETVVMSPIRPHYEIEEATPRPKNESRARHIPEVDPAQPGGLMKRPSLEVPGLWHDVLPHERSVVVLPYQNAQRFRALCQTASVIPRSDGDSDIIGVLRDGIKPVWITGILQADPKKAQGTLDFGGKHRLQKGIPELGFTILYGHPKKFNRQLDWLCEDLEKQFGRIGLNPELLRHAARNWEPYFRPFSAMLESLENLAFAVIFSGSKRHIGALGQLGINAYPLLTPVTRKIANTFWENFPYEIGKAGGFAKQARPDA